MQARNGRRRLGIVGRLALPLMMIILGCVSRGWKIEAEAPSTKADYVESGVQLTSGRFLDFDEAYTKCDRLWGSRALIFGRWRILYPGEANPSDLLPRGRSSPIMGGNPTYAKASERLLLWTDVDRQLCAVSLRDKRAVSLTSISRGSITWDESVLELLPVRSGPAVVDDPRSNRFFFVLAPCDGDDNDVSFLSSVSRNCVAGTMRPDREIQGVVKSWALSPRRQSLYVVKSHAGACRLIELPIEVVNKGEQSLDAHVILDRCGKDIAISPDENWLLVERPERIGIDPREGPASRSLGFYFVNLDGLEKIDGPTSGHQGAWSPDGSSVAYLDGWDVRLFDVATRSDRRVFRIRGASLPSDGPRNNDGPVWSPEEGTFFVNVGENDGAQVVDLRRKRFLILGEGSQSWQVGWAPMPCQVR